MNRNTQSQHASATTRRLVTTSVVHVGILLGFAGLAQAAGGGDDHGSAVMETIWQAVNLAIIIGVIVYFGRKPIAAYFADRRGSIETELSAAADLLAQAEQRNSELQRKLVALSSEVEGIQENASRRAEEEAERILADARATAERIRRDAKSAVEQELRRAQAELREEAADLAMDIAARKLGDQVEEADRDRLIDEFITRVEPTAAEGANR